MLLIPAIDLRNGRCVRLFQGDFGAETRYDHEPHELLLRYRGFGASWLHVVDLDGAKDGVLANRSVIVALGIPESGETASGWWRPFGRGDRRPASQWRGRGSWSAARPWNARMKSRAGSRALARSASAWHWIFALTRAASLESGHTVGKTGPP